jgi:hypothetical protein
MWQCNLPGEAAMMRIPMSLLTCLLLLGVAPVCAQQDLPQSGQAPPNTAERWVLEQTRSGKIADLGHHCKQQKDLDAAEDLNPSDSDDTRWLDPCRAIGAAFITQVLTEEAWQGVLARQGLRIIGAQVTDALDLSAGHIAAVVWLEKSRFQGNRVNLSWAKFERELSFEGSTFEHGLVAFGLHVGSSLHLSDKVAVRGEPLDLSGAKVRGDLAMDGSTFEKGIQASDLQVGGNLCLRDNAAVHGEPLNLSGAKVDGNLGMNGSTFETSVHTSDLQVGHNLLLQGSVFEKGFHAPRMKVGGNLFLHNKAAMRGEPLDLSGAKVGGDLEMDGSTFETSVQASDLQVGHNLFLQRSVFEKGFYAPRMKVGSSLLLHNNAAVRGEPLNLSGAKVEGDLGMNGSTFEKGIQARGLQVGGNLFLHDKAAVRGEPLNLIGAKVGGDLAMDGSTFEKGIQASNLQVGRNLFLRDKAAVRGEPLNLLGAKVEGDLAMDGSTFETSVQASDLQVGHNLLLQGSVFEKGFYAPHMKVGSSLFLRDKAAVRGEPLNLMGAKVEGDLAMDGSTFEKGIQARGLQVGRDLLLRDKAVVRGEPLNLMGAKVEGNLSMISGDFESVGAERLHVGGHLLLRDAIFATPPKFSFSRVEGGVNLTGAQLPGLDLSSTSIGSELRLASLEDSRPQWGPEARLILRNVKVGALQDHVDVNGIDAWPGHLGHQGNLDLQGFTYDRLLGVGGISRSMLLSDGVGWLMRDLTFARQPYQQLAAVFRAAGEPDRANAVLYAARDRELAQNWEKGEYLDALGLILLKYTIGYGLGSSYFLALLWVVVFTMTGVVVLWFSPWARAKGQLWCIGASLDHLLPIVEMNKEFGDCFNDPQRRRLAGWQVSYFAIQALVGYVLASFVVAGLAGLTQAQ